MSLHSSDNTATLLVVDDNETSLYGKVRVLRGAGFDVLQATRGEEALRIIAQRKPHVVLLDIHLPDVSGWEVCRRIKADPATAFIPVLQISATFVGESDKVRALEGGADACLTEPMEPTVLVATVRALLRARQAEEALRDALTREQALRGAAEAANRAKDEFLATLSHELRSPLGAILTWVSLMRAGRLDPAHSQRAIEAIERNTRLQMRMIEDLLDVSRIVSGKMELDIGLVDLGTVLEAALESVRPAAAAKGITIESSVDPALGPVSGDALRLQQVIGNLLSNSIKFTPRSGKLQLRLRSEDGQAELQVSDTGQGIDAATLPHVFERFRQQDSTSTRAEGGLGLGLAIVRHFVELHNGTVQAKSPGPGQGATFIVRLPLVKSAVASSFVVAGPGRAALPRVNLPSLRGARALVVDDEEDSRDAIAMVLEQCGASVSTAASVVEALAVFERRAPDVLVTDIAMPREDGLVLIRKVRSLPVDRGGQVPALALTAYAGAADERRILAAGFQGYLKKPVAAAELGDAVAKLLPRS